MVILTVYKVGETLFAILTVTGNAVVLIAIYNHRYLHNPTNVFIGHLAAADVMYGLLVPPIAIISSLNLDMAFHSCILLNSILMIIANAENFVLLGVTVERFVAIRFPFKYHEVFDHRNAHYLALLAWAAGFFSGLFPLFGWNPGAENYGPKCGFLSVISKSYLIYWIFFVMFVVQITIMISIYYYIMRIIREHLKKSDELYSRFKVKIKKDAKTTRSLVYVLVAFFLSQVPLHMNNCMDYYEVTPWSEETSFIFLHISILVNRVSPMLNPVIYAASTTKMKAAMLNVVLCRPYKIYGKSIEETYTKENHNNSTTIMNTGEGERICTESGVLTPNCPDVINIPSSESLKDTSCLKGQKSTPSFQTAKKSISHGSHSFQKSKRSTCSICSLSPRSRSSTSVEM